MTDFATKDAAVAAMKGVALNVDPKLNIYDMTHDIESYHVLEGAFKLAQSIDYWPKKLFLLQL